MKIGEIDERERARGEVQMREEGGEARILAALYDMHDLIGRDEMYDLIQEEMPGDRWYDDQVAAAGERVASARIIEDSRWERVAVRFLLMGISEEMGEAEPRDFGRNILHLIKTKKLDERMGAFRLYWLADEIEGYNDERWTLLGLRTIRDRYLLRDDDGRVAEMPQWFLMRVAMGLALNEAPEHNERAIEFYQAMSEMRFLPATPTLFNSGTTHPQLSSCYISAVPDDLGGIYDAMRDNALLSKFAGGLANDWTDVRGMGARIAGTDGESRGVIPFMKVANDTALAVNQGGKRPGACAAYLEVWHADLLDFLQLRNNTGDDRRRTHDMHTALWIPDLFMKRLAEEERRMRENPDGEPVKWSLFCPSLVPGLHDLYGEKFEEAYEKIEAVFLRNLEENKATPKGWTYASIWSIWCEIMGRLFETGHPWLCFKDTCNYGNAEKRKGVVRSSNLCTEITLNTEPGGEIAVCNLGSINLVKHLKKGEEGNWRAQLDAELLEKTTETAMRMLDNAIDLNYYPVERARKSNLKHRPVGLGMMGLADAIQLMGLEDGFAGEEAKDFGDAVTEQIAFNATRASILLARERGRYPAFKSSEWDRGVFPRVRGYRAAEKRLGRRLLGSLERWDYNGSANAGLAWADLKDALKVHGIRNSNLTSIAPTATISNIAGVSPSIEPRYSNMFTKSNQGGEFLVINPVLRAELERLEHWNADTIADLKANDGSVMNIHKIPNYIRRRYRTAFEVEPETVVEAAALRQKWLCQSQSVNIWAAFNDGARLSRVYQRAWARGLKTTYYLRTRAATRVEPSAGEAGELNAVSREIEDDCEVCQ